MPTVDPKIAETIQSPTPGEFVTLYQLDTTAIGNDQILYFADAAFESSALVFDGNAYVPVDMKAEGFEYNGRGALPTPKITISNANKILSSLVIQFNDLMGAKLTRLRTFRKHLDDGTDPDVNAHFPLDIYTVERKVQHNKIFIEFELSAAMDQEGRLVPARQVLRDACTHRYRIFSNHNVVSLTRSGSTATCTVDSDHGLVTNDKVKMINADQSEYNGIFDVTVTGPTTFTYPVSGAPVTPATGEILAGYFDYDRATCPYVGNIYFKQNSDGTLDLELDHCGKRLSDCERRFPDASLPTRAFPGVARVRGI